MNRADSKRLQVVNWVVTVGSMVVELVVSPNLVPLSVLLVLGSMGLFTAACEDEWVHA